MTLQILIEDLPQQYQEMARIIGIDNTVKLAQELGGTSVYFPKLDSLTIKARDRELIREFDGQNIRHLAIKYGITAVHTRGILRKAQRDGNK